MHHQVSHAKKILISMVLFVYCSGLSSVILPLVEYAADYQRIIAEECENIEVPELECNGKCYLATQITKQTAPESKETNNTLVVQKSGVDPHYTPGNTFGIIVSMNAIPLNVEMTLKDVILSKIDPPPQC